MPGRVALWDVLYYTTSKRCMSRVDGGLNWYSIDLYPDIDIAFVVWYNMA